jgi:hypothetical protein
MIVLASSMYNVLTDEKEITLYLPPLLFASGPLLFA